jgi:predicted O-methyltransferase YrrM
VTFDELVERARTFQESRVLLTAIELDVFTAVGGGAPASAVAGRLGTDPRATEMLLNALAALGALTKNEGIFHNTPYIAQRLVAGSPECERAALMHTVHLWERWSALTGCVRAGTAQGVAGVKGRGETWIDAFIAAMHHNATARAAQVVEAVGAEGVRRMLDVGGGSGAYSIAFAQASPALNAEVLDLPQVVPIAQGHIQRAGLADRVRTRPGDLRTDALGKSYDLVFISAICHMLGPEENRDLFRRSFQALAPGGRVAVQDFILEPDKTAPRAAALFSLNMLVGTENGASYSQQEYALWLREAGFLEVRRIRLPEPAGLMLGTRGRKNPAMSGARESTEGEANPPEAPEPLQT